MRRINSNFHKLHTLKDARPKLRKAIISNCDKDLVNCVSECALNLLHGNVKLSDCARKKVAKIQTSAQNGCLQARACGSQEKVDRSARRIPSTIADGSTALVGISHLRRLEEVGYVTNVTQDVSPPTPPTPTTQMPTQPQQESRTKRIKKKKTTKHGRRRRVTEEQHPYDRWVKMRGEMQEADIYKKTLIQKIADFLQKVLPNSNAFPKQTVAPAPPPPPPPPPPPLESPGTQKECKSEAPASPSGTPFLSREHESLFESPIKRSLSTDSEDDEGAARYVPGESSVRNSARDILVP